MKSAERGGQRVVLDATDPAATRLATAVRGLQDVARGSLLPPERAEELAVEIDRVTAQVRSAGAEDAMGELTLSPGTKGAGQTLAPVFEVREVGATHINGVVAFTRFHLGADAATHGGALSMWVDDILGRLAFGLSEHLTRTAFLHIEFRSLVPIDTPAEFSAWLDRRDGRKRHLRATLSVAGTLAIEAHGLWIETTTQPRQAPD